MTAPWKVLVVMLTNVAGMTDKEQSSRPFRVPHFSRRCRGRFERTIIRTPADYSKNLHPPGDPNEVDVAFHIEDLTGVNQEYLTMKVDVYLAWNDSRLNFGRLPGQRSRARSWIPLGPEVKDLIWVPSLTSVGLLEFRSMGTIRSHERLALTHMPERRLFYQTLTLVTFSCSMDFSDFPFDKNVCYFQVSLNSPVTVATWRHLDLTWDRATSILEFDFSFADLPEEAKIQEVRHVEAGRIRSSLQSMAGFQIFLSRKINTYVLNYYVPSGLCVIVSWMSFFIPPDSVPARITLIITTFLALVNIANSAFSNSPQADSINPIQIWILLCMSFVFSTVIEYTVILLYQRYTIRKTLVTRGVPCFEGVVAAVTCCPNIWLGQSNESCRSCLAVPLQATMDVANVDGNFLHTHFVY